MASEVVQNSLPSIALLFNGVAGLALEAYAHVDAFRTISEFDLRCAITEGILDEFMLHDFRVSAGEIKPHAAVLCLHAGRRSEEHTSELQSLMRISYAVFCLKKKKHLLSTKIIIKIDTL